MLNAGSMDAGDWISVVAAFAAIAGWIVAARSAKAAQDSAAVALAQLELMREQYQAQVAAAEQAEIPKIHMFVRQETTGSVVILQNTGTAPLAIDGVLLDGERYAWTQQRQPSDGLKARGVLGALEETLLLHAIGEGAEHIDGLLHPSESTRALELHLR